MGSTKLFKEGSVSARVFAILLSVVLVVSLAPSIPAAAYAAQGDTLVAGKLAAQDGTVNGGSEITENGTYTLAENATGTITIGEGLDNVKIVGESWDAASGMFNTTVYTGLNIKVGDSSTLVIENIHANQGETASTIDFEGNGTLKIEGNNLIDNDGGLNAAVIHVAKDAEVHFDGTGTLYGYKSALCSYIGGSANEANGKIVFDGGYWFLKGSKTGAVIGGDSTTDKGGDIVVNGGELYVKGVARGALIGGSNQGLSGDVYIAGGLVELFEDFSGPAIGAGSNANAGNVYVTGGSLKTTLSSNSANSYGESAVFGGMPGVSWKAVKAANADDYALLAFDASAYIDDMSTDTVTVYLDGATTPFYSGRAYTYVTNEVKNPTLEVEGCSTMANWLANDAANLVTEADYSGAYPTKNGSSLVPEKNLYFALSKQDHVLTVDGNAYNAVWNAEAGAFSVEPVLPAWYADGAATNNYEISTAAELVDFANIVNGTYAAVPQDNFEGKTVKLADSIDLSGIADWAPIGTESAAFAGTFDGQGKAVTGLTIATGEGGYKGLFGNNAGTVKDLAVSGTIGTSEAYITTGADNIGGVVGYNNGTVSGVSGNVAVFVNSENIYAVGGIVGQNGPNGKVEQCINAADINASKASGGVVGRNYGTITKCVNTGDVTGNQGRKDGIGGVLGYGGDKSATYENDVTFCYNTGTISNNDGRFFGGIAGYADSATLIANCYNVGQISTGYSSQWNPICGSVDGSDNRYANWSGNYSLEGLGAGDTEEATKPLTIGTVVSADDMKSAVFVAVLNQFADGTQGVAFNADTDAVNGGFPVLAWQGGSAIASVEDDPAIKAVIDAVSAIENPVTLENKAKVEAAIDAYGALSDLQKAFLPADTDTAYQKAVADFDALMLTQTTEAVAAIPEDVTTEAGMAAVEEALEAYNALSDEQKAQVPAAAAAMLIAAQQTVAEAKIDAVTTEKDAAVSEAVAAKAEATQLQKDVAAAQAAQTAAEKKATDAAAAQAAAEKQATEAKAAQAAAEKKATEAAAAKGKANNPMTVKAKTITAKAKKNTTVKKAKAFTVKNAQGKVTFAKISGNAKITVTKAGKVIVKKGLKKNKTVKAKVLVVAAGNNDYAPATKTVTLKVKVK